MPAIAAEHAALGRGRPPGCSPSRVGPRLRDHQADDVADDHDEDAEVEQRAAEPQQPRLVELRRAGGPAELVVPPPPDGAADAGRDERHDVRQAPPHRAARSAPVEAHRPRPRPWRGTEGSGRARRRAAAGRARPPPVRGDGPGATRTRPARAACGDRASTAAPAGAARCPAGGRTHPQPEPDVRRWPRTPGDRREAGAARARRPVLRQQLRAWATAGRAAAILHGTTGRKSGSSRPSAARGSA